MRRIKREKKEIESRYLKFQLINNPFPNIPVARYVDRKRITFCSDVHTSIINQIERNWIGYPNFSMKKRIGFLWAMSPGVSDKGMGKSAILFHVIDKLNRNFGELYFDDRKICAVYVYAGTDWAEPRLILVDAMRRLFEEGVINEAINGIAIDIIEEKGIDIEQVLETPSLLFDDQWLGQNGLSVPLLQEFISARLVSFGVQEPLAESAAHGNYLEYLKSKRSDRSLRLPPASHDWRLHKEAPFLFYDQTMRILAAGGFDHCYLFVDDIENVIRHTKMTRKKLDDMARLLGGGLFRNEHPSASTLTVDDVEYGPMLSMFLTTHYKAADDLSSGWRDAGYDTFAPLSSASQNSICVGSLKNEDCVNLTVSYLSSSRPPEFNGENLYPFEEEAVIAIGEHSSYHPRKLLNNLHIIIEAGVEDNGIDTLDKENAMALLEGQESVPEQDVDPLSDFGDDLGFDE